MAQLLNTQIDGALGFGSITNVNKMITIQNLGISDSHSTTGAFTVYMSSSSTPAQFYATLPFDVDYLFENDGSVGISVGYIISKTTNGSWRSYPTGMSMDDAIGITNDENDPKAITEGTVAINSSNTTGTVYLSGAARGNRLYLSLYHSGGASGVTYYLDEVFLTISGPLRPNSTHGDIVIGKPSLLIDNNSAATNNNIFINSTSLDGAITQFGNNSIVIGKPAAIGNLRRSNVVLIGADAGCSALGPTTTLTNATTSGNGATWINCKYTTDLAVAIGIGVNPLQHITRSSYQWTTISDSRDKTDFLDINQEDALKFVSKLKPVTYVMNSRDSYTENGDISTFDVKAYLNGDKKHFRRVSGFKAQEVYETLKEVFKSDNYASIVDYNNYDGDIDTTKTFDRYFIRITDMIPFLVAAIQEQDKKIQELETAIKELKENKDTK